MKLEFSGKIFEKSSDIKVHESPSAMKLEFSGQIFEESSKLNFMKIHPHGA